MLGKAVAFTGPSNSGKTTLILKVASILMDRGHEVAIVKNDPKDKARFDVEGKDSFKFFQTGADTVVVSPHRTTLFSHKTRELDEITRLFTGFDFMLVEGLKHLPLPRAAVFRGKLDESYFDYSQAMAVDDTVEIPEGHVPPAIEILDLNNPDQVADWVENHAEKVREA